MRQFRILFLLGLLQAAAIRAATPVILTPTIPAGGVGVSYQLQLQASGGTAPYSYSLSSGTLPVGLSLSPAGVISGSPTTTGNLTFKLQVTDSASAKSTRSYAQTIVPAPPPDVPAAYVDLYV